MVDPLSVTAVTGVLSAMSASMATEAGKAVYESFGAVVRRVFGREVPAPAGARERAELAALIVERVRQEPEQARVLAQWMGAQGAVGGPVGHGVPALLPPSARFFTDRARQLAALEREAARKPDGRGRLAALVGPELIGTTALAVHFGHREVERFPDGQLYADLRGGSLGSSPEPTVVLRYFLSRLGVPDPRIPPVLEDRVDLYRTLLAERRLLVVLDHAQSAAQVRPLITTAPGVFTVVIARRPLTGLEAVLIEVGPLPDRDAKRLLTDLAGKQAVAAARATLPAVLERCAGSPFALRSAAQYLTAVPPARNGAAAVDPVRAAIEDRYREFDPRLASFYRCNALRPWPAIGVASAAAAAGVPRDQAARMLAELTDLGLLEQTAAGRFRYRPAARAHAEQEALREVGPAARLAATAGAIERYLRFAVQADYAALPKRWHVGPLFSQLGPGRYEGEGAALEALGAELGNLLEAVRAAEELGDPDTVCQLVEALWAVQLKAGQIDLMLPALRSGARAAGLLRDLDPRMVARMHTQLAFGLMEAQLYDEAEVQLLAAADAARATGQLVGQATALESLGLLRLRQWRFRAALACFDDAGQVLDGIAEGDPGAQDLPRARALLQRHCGRARRGLGDLAQADDLLTGALAFFRGGEGGEGGEQYNAARTLSDLAETRLLAGRPAEALSLIEEAAAILAGERADVHLIDLGVLRRRCQEALR
ncbi:tetratricopeptide repeat protein [Kitasatospora sp. NBC_01287]|uniref:tetratricopeptide repeat protein n=1 Tax=Kitasatospora sp. NBC_01287 TaxID=2903573 RepID=UPI0022533C62|nr:tetratricopeptide repeat protein [Kitasatospora sp. NBC_01287]MCX4749349.1 tetratricopeptide repeat protein [Kitasatospora sp. NBC_01287]